MNTRKVKEPEILDVLLGGEDGALEARVRQAVRQDMTSAAQYAEWAQTLPALRQELEPVARLGRRARAKVMERLLQEKGAHEAGWMPPEDARLVAGINAAKSRVSRLERPRRWRRWAPALGICAAGVIGLVFAAWWALAPGGPATVVRVSGQVLAQSLAPGGAAKETIAIEGRDVAKSKPVVWQPGGKVLRDDSPALRRQAFLARLAPGARLRLPFRIQAAEGGQAEVRLSDGSVMTVSGGATLTAESVRRMNQASGQVAYRTAHAPLRERFTVLIPQGRVVDLGTEFKVEVAQTGQSVVDVREGRVRVQPARGAAVEARAGDQAILSPTAAVVLPPPALDRNSRTSETQAKKNEAAEAPLRIEFRPALAALASGSPLAALPQPRAIPLSAAAPPALVRRVPPFTSPQPLFGVLRMKMDGRAIEAALACDKKVNGRWRIYLDANLDGDLTNDTSFYEGEDFVADHYFEAGLLDHNNALWLRRPLGGGPGEEPDRLEFVDRLYASGTVALPAENGTPLQGVRLNLIDTDGDGDLFDPQGALAVWTVKGQAGLTDPISAIANAGTPSVFAGRQWVLGRRADGAYELTGRKLATLRKRALHVGGPLPPLEVQTIDGRRLQLPPRGRWLLIYVWTTWFSSGQRDAPFSIEGLYPKFKDRGLSMVGVCVDYRKDELVNYLKTSDPGYPQVFSGPEVWAGVAGDLGVDDVPTTILADPQGRIVALGKSGEEIWSLLDASLPAARK